MRHCMPGYCNRNSVPDSTGIPNRWVCPKRSLHLMKALSERAFSPEAWRGPLLWPWERGTRASSAELACTTCQGHCLGIAAFPRCCEFSASSAAGCGADRSSHDSSLRNRNLIRGVDSGSHVLRRQGGCQAGRQSEGSHREGSKMGEEQEPEGEDDDGLCWCCLCEFSPTQFLDSLRLKKSFWHQQELPVCNIKRNARISHGIRSGTALAGRLELQPNDAHIPMQLGLRRPAQPNSSNHLLPQKCTLTQKGGAA